MIVARGFKRHPDAVLAASAPAMRDTLEGIYRAVERALMADGSAVIYLGEPYASLGRIGELCREALRAAGVAPPGDPQ